MKWRNWVREISTAELPIRWCRFAAFVPIPKGKTRAASCRPASVLVPGSALGSCRHGALSSAQAVFHRFEGRHRGFAPPRLAERAYENTMILSCDRVIIFNISLYLFSPAPALHRSRTQLTGSFYGFLFSVPGKPEGLGQMQRRVVQRQAMDGRPEVQRIALDPAIRLEASEHVLAQMDREGSLPVSGMAVHAGRDRDVADRRRASDPRDPDAPAPVPSSLVGARMRNRPGAASRWAASPA